MGERRATTDDNDYVRSIGRERAENWRRRGDMDILYSVIMMIVEHSLDVGWKKLLNTSFTFTSQHSYNKFSFYVQSIHLLCFLVFLFVFLFIHQLHVFRSRVQDLISQATQRPIPLSLITEQKVLNQHPHCRF